MVSVKLLDINRFLYLYSYICKVKKMDESNIDTKALEQNQPTSPGSQEDSENKQEPEEYTSITYSLALEKIQQSIKDPEVLISLIEKEALSREIPPTPITVSLLKLSISARGLV